MEFVGGLIAGMILVGAPLGYFVCRYKRQIKKHLLEKLAKYNG